MYIINVIKSIYETLNIEQKRYMHILQLIFVLSAFIQILGVTSIAPFIGIISNPESIQTNKVLSNIYTFIGFQSNNEFIVAFALTSIAMIIVSNSVGALTLWLSLRFSMSIGNEIQSKLFENFIYRNYLFHKNTNYNKLIATIIADSPRFIYMVLQPYLMMCSQILVALVISIGLIYLDPFIAVGAVAIVGGAYLIIYWTVKKSLNLHGGIITKQNMRIQTLLSEAFIGIKDIKLNGLEERYTESYSKINRKGLKSHAHIALTGDIPRFAIESISFSAILLFGLLLLSSKTDSATIVSILSVYALAGYKLLPAMQQIFKSLSSISANGSVVTELRHELNASHKVRIYKTNPLTKIEKIELKNVSYRYPNAEKWVLKDVDITFRRGYLNTIAGPSGSGKSTLADIALGLLEPTEGGLYADDELLSREKQSSYQRSIGYVPQNVFILDDDVASNVAFGVSKEDIDIERVVYALRQASALEFVQKLPDGINTHIGQDGKLLSGGQRQRLGIARALYEKNLVLILDEPTSALDLESEHELMQLLNNLKNVVLTIVISHRPAAIRFSDVITVVSDGSIIANGNYDTLFNNNQYFQTMMEKGLMTPSDS